MSRNMSPMVTTSCTTSCACAMRRINVRSTSAPKTGAMTSTTALCPRTPAPTRAMRLLPGPDEAYRFARGEQVLSSTGQPARLRRPYDFLVVADHAENLGLAPMIAASDPLVLQNPTGKRWHDMVSAGKGFEAFADWIQQGSTTGKDPIDSPEMMRAAWEQIIDSAERFNEPGRFTALIGFEWTSTPSGNNLHRNVLLRDDGERARQVVPFSGYDSDDPEKLKAIASWHPNVGNHHIRHEVLNAPDGFAGLLRGAANFQVDGLARLFDGLQIGRAHV